MGGPESQASLGRIQETVGLQVELTLHSTQYIVCVSSANGESVEVLVEQKEDASAWRGQFAAKYIEDLTAKTGSYKKFAVFVHMLLTALRQESDAVFIDLLTYADLELLKSKRAGASNSNSIAGQGPQPPAAATAAQGAGSAPQAPQPAQPPASNKRYLILTYAAEFDRVHYPLPLQYDDSPDPQRLRDTIRQLRAQLAGHARSGGGGGVHHSRRPPAGVSPAAELRTLREENGALKQQLQALEAQLGGGLAADVQQLTADAQETIRDLRGMRKERDALLLSAQQGEAALEGERNLHRRELRRRAKAAADVEAELAAAKDQIRELRLKCRELAQELDLAQRRAKVASLTAASAYAARPLGASARATPQQSRGLSPAGSRHLSRDASPAPAGSRGVGLAGGMQGSRTRSAEPSRPTSRPVSAGRFDPTDYVRQKRDRERDAARRLDEERRRGRVMQPSRPSSYGGSMPASRPSSMPSSRHSTPQRSHVSSRDPSVDRTRQLAADRARQAARDRSAERGLLRSAPHSASHERSVLARSNGERVRGATVSASRRLPDPEQRAASPGRALLEVKQRLQQFVDRGPGSRSGTAVGAPATATAAPGQQQQQHQRRTQPAGDNYADASADIADIDARLQSLQTFLKAAKAKTASV